MISGDILLTSFQLKKQYDGDMMLIRKNSSQMKLKSRLIMR